MGAMRTLSLAFRPVVPEDAPLLHRLFLQSPGYFALIGMEPPTLEDVVRDLATLEKDERRRAFLLLREGEAVGYMDYKLHYPEPQDATLSLLLIREDHQGQGLGQRALAHLMAHLAGAERLYVVVYGDNPRAKAFFQAQGFRHVKDGGPALSWYVREL
ncbi:GNAT family N-acetyltransferase [Thermus thermamylovorans]|uniref:GNAT family N-acetyltransferase n=1 Tax=Thermus thermamylovorans TaxID=2509362 RepID=A0A4Q9B4A6_9DEIN|nr:GNAT family N-acetyltransferase [Thermus thermamylovorans]TBH20768.1 GNAT family N-acetyltransferase [Thermus thermamylovorans]